MKVRCLLVDDEPPALKLLASYLSNISGYEVVALCSNAIEALQILRQRQVDVIFLDIKMPKMLGIDFIRSLSNKPKTVLVTAYEDYAILGYELDVVDYLLKPVSFERFVKAISKLNWALGLGSASPGPEQEAVKESFVYLRVEREMTKIDIAKIRFVESLKDYVKIHFKDKTIVVKQSISSMEHLLSDHSFIRVHRSYIVSKKEIVSVDNSTIKLGSDEIPIGRLYKINVFERLGISRC